MTDAEKELRTSRIGEACKASPKYGWGKRRLVKVVSVLISTKPVCARLIDPRLGGMGRWSAPALQSTSDRLRSRIPTDKNYPRSGQEAYRVQRLPSPVDKLCNVSKLGGTSDHAA